MHYFGGSLLTFTGIVLVVAGSYGCKGSKWVLDQHKNSSDFGPMVVDSCSIVVFCGSACAILLGSICVVSGVTMIATAE